MPPPKKYIQSAYAALKDNLDGFNKTPEDFEHLVTSDAGYRGKVYTALKDNLDGFDKAPKDFDTLILGSSAPTIVDTRPSILSTIPKPASEPFTRGDIASLPNVPKPKEFKTDTEANRRITETQKTRDEAVFNTVKRKFENTGRKFDEKSPAFQNEINNLRKKQINGDVVVVKSRSGKPEITRSAGFGETFFNTIANSVKSSIDAPKINSISDPKKLADVFDERAKDELDIPESAPSRAGGFFGEAFGGAVKPIALLSLNGLTAGVGTGVMSADAYNTSIAAHREQLYHKGLQENLDKGMPREEARIKAASDAMTAANVEALPDAAVALALSGTGKSVKAATAQKTFVQALKVAGKDVAKMGGIGATSGAAKAGIEALNGYDVSAQDAFERSLGEGKDLALMDIAFKLGQIPNIPAYLKASRNEYLSRLPKEIIQEKAAEIGQDGVKLTQELSDYENARKKVEDIVPDEHLPQFAGLAQKQENLSKSIKKLEASKGGVHPTLTGKIDEEINALKDESEAIDKQMGTMLESDHPIEHEVDDVTGEKPKGTPEEISKPIEIPQEDTPVPQPEIIHLDNKGNEVVVNVEDIEKRRKEELSSIKQPMDYFKDGAEVKADDGKTYTVRHVGDRGNFLLEKKGRNRNEDEQYGAYWNKKDVEEGGALSHFPYLNGHKDAADINVKYDAELAVLKEKNNDTTATTGASEPVPTNEIKPEEQKNTGAVSPSPETVVRGNAETTPTLLDEPPTENNSPNQQGEQPPIEEVPPVEVVGEKSEGAEKGTIGNKAKSAMNSFVERGDVTMLIWEESNGVVKVGITESEVSKNGSPMNSHPETVVELNSSEIKEYNKIEADVALGDLSRPEGKQKKNELAQRVIKRKLESEGAEGGNGEPPKEGAAEANAKGDDEWTAIRQSKLKEIEGVRKVFEKETGKKWTDIQQQALEGVQQEHPEKSLYEAVKAKTEEIAAKYDNPNIDYNPTAKDLAVIQEFKRQTEKKINQAEQHLNSDDDAQRQGAILQLDSYNNDLINAGKARHKREAGTAFGFRQSESRMDENYGLQIRRMQLMKAQGGEKLTPEQNKWTEEQWNKEKEIIKREQEIREQGLKEEFDRELERVRKEYEAKATTKEASVTLSEAETLKQKGKKLADKLRKLKTQKGTLKMDFTLGGWDLAVEGIAKLVEGGASLAEAIDNLIKEKTIAFKEERGRNTFEKMLLNALGRDDVFEKIENMAKATGETTVTNEMAKDLVRDYVNSHIGQYEQKDIFDAALKGLKEILPDLDKKTLLEAYLREGEFKQPSKGDLESQLTKAKKELANIAKLTEDIDDLSGLKEVRQRVFPSAKEKSEYEQSLRKQKEDSIKFIAEQRRKLQDDYSKLEAERNRQIKRAEALKEKKAKLEQGIVEKSKKVTPAVDTPEIEELKKQVKELEKSIASAEADRKKAERQAVAKQKSTLKKDNLRIQAEVARQMKRVTELQEKKSKLEQGIREKRAATPPKTDTPEIENLKAEVKKADDELRKIENEQKKSEREAQSRKDKIAELDANIERAKKDRDLITTYKKKSDKQIDEEIEAKKRELKKAIADNSSDEREQAAKLAQRKKRVQSDIKSLERRIAAGDFVEEKKNIALKNADFELIELEKKKSQLESAYKLKQRELVEKNKGKATRAMDFARSLYVNALIGGTGTYAKIALMAITRPFSEAVTKVTGGNLFDALYPSIAKPALKGGEGQSMRVIQHLWGGFFKQMGEAKMQQVFKEATDAAQIAVEEYEKYKNSASPNPEKLKALEQTAQGKTLDAYGKLVYQFIGGSSIKDAWSALVSRSNRIELSFGGIEPESFKDGNALDKAAYIASLVGRSHSALKTFSGRASFAAGFMARIEAAIKDGSINRPERIIEIAHESYLDFERGKYQQSNYISEKWNQMTKSLSQQMTDHPEWDKFNTVSESAVRGSVPITRVPINILWEEVAEYTVGAFRAVYMAAKEIKSAKKEAQLEGVTGDDFKRRVKEIVSNMDEKQAATIKRAFRKGGMGIGLYAFALVSGLIHFGIFPHLGQKKKKDEHDLAYDELNPGQVQVGGTKLGGVASGAIEHTPVLWPMFMGLGMAQIYHNDLSKGKGKNVAVWDAAYTHLQVVEGGIPQMKVFGIGTKTTEAAAKVAKKRLTEIGLFDDTKESTSHTRKRRTVRKKD